MVPHHPQQTYHAERTENGVQPLRKLNLRFRTPCRTTFHIRRLECRKLEQSWWRLLLFWGDRQLVRKESKCMKSLSAAIIVTAGVTLVSSSQWCAASIMDLTPNHSIDIASRGVTIGICLAIAGMLGWGYTLLSRTASSRGSEQ